MDRSRVRGGRLGGAPWYAWRGGFCGAFSLTAISLTFSRLGPGLAFGLLVAGQLDAPLVASASTRPSPDTAALAAPPNIFRREK
ncbi:MAG: DMT family transporter [Hyalangium sp.]|uniref:DMT family transporter n=1 Tax=Hyalangium sp. TaxID=2028555 RepID=UPI003899D2DC